jgi:hypothetical protein
MKNPYEILFGLAYDGKWQNMQNATRQEITKAFPLAMKANAKLKRYAPQELMLAQKQLLSPAKRLAADFMFPAKYKTKRPQKLTTNVNTSSIDLNNINENTFDDLDKY